MNIGDAAAASGISAKMIRYYEDTGLLPPSARTASGYRSYGPREVRILRFIRRARDLGFSMAQIGDLLSLWQDKARHSSEVKRLAEDHLATLDRRIAEMQAMAATLRHLSHACCGDDRPDCPILQDLEGQTAQ
jgi:MerR family gold-responsive transcriptional activator of gol and ges genes